MESPLALSIRQSEILELARAEGRVLVDDLAQRFEVTLQTIRRDHSKLGRPAPARIGSLSELDAVFTDRPLPEDLARRCAEWGTEVRVCPPG